MKYSVAAVVLCCAVTVFGAAVKSDVDAKCHGLNCPKYTVLNKTDDWELRHYDATKWVATNATAMTRDVVNSDMFDKLFAYITGSNDKHMKIDMTTPVITKVLMGPGPNCKSTFIMHFMVPFQFWNAAPIQPSDPTVFLVEIPAMDVYVGSFSGFAKETDYIDALHRLYADLSKAGLGNTIQEGFLFEGGYDGPYTFVNRHNEVWLAKK